MTLTRSLDEAASLVGCSTRTLRRYVALGLVGAVRVGGPRGALRFTDQDVEDAKGVLVVRVERTATAVPGQTALITLDGSINPDAVPQNQDVSRPAA